MSTRPSPGFKKVASDSFYQMWWNLKNNTNQTSLKGAVYNLVIVIVVAAIVAVCLVLGPFLRPLLWSVLIGAVLFPFKYSLSFTLKRWFDRLEENDTHLLVGIALAPLEALDSFGAYLTSVFNRHKEVLIGGVIGLMMLSLFISYTPKGFCYAVWEYIRCGHHLFTTALSSIDYAIVVAVIVVYLTLLAIMWKQENSFMFTVVGQTLWIVIVAYGCSFLGALQVPVFVATLIYALVGIIYDMKSTNSTSNLDNSGPVIEQIVSFLNVPSSFYGTPQSSVIGNISSRVQSIIDEPSESSTPKTKMHLNIKATGENEQQNNESLITKSQSDIYFKALFLACFMTILYNHVWMAFIALIPILIYLINKMLLTFGIKDIVYEQFVYLTAGVQDWIDIRRSAVLPLCLPGVIRLNNKIHRKVRRAMKESIDTASSILMIVLLILTVIFASIFCIVEIYSETITVVQLGNDVVNYTLYHRPELLDVFPEGVISSLDNVIENAYQYGRTTIETYVDKLLKDADKEQRGKLTAQLLNIWDRLIQYWVNRNKDSNLNGPNVPAFAITESIEEVINNEELLSVAQQGLIGWVKTNIGMLMEVMDSIWLIVKANLNILTTFIWTLFSLFLGGGQAVITFLVNSLIFLTSLFYLLSSSQDKYAPLAATSFIGFSSGPRIAEAIEASISSVLIASTKLALFHGLFTWLTHTIFGARVVFLPAVFAGILAAVPFLGTYWCSIPAFFDLWLIQDRFSLGIILLLVHFLFPTSFVDPAIYADVNGDSSGGHAYLTGLSIAGGMFWLGWEGAIFGPILLCLLVVIFNLTTNALKDSPTTPGVKSDYRPTDRRHSSFQNSY